MSDPTSTYLDEFVKRAKLTEKLRRMAATIDAGQTPMQVREFYVFGSYARGALEPNDLDVLVVHDRLPECVVERLREEILSSDSFQGELLGRLQAKTQSLMRGSLRRPGERIELLLAESKSNVVGPGSKIPEDELVLLWTPSERDFNAKIDAIVANPEAGRAPRNHFVNIKRLDTDITTMERTMELIANGQLQLSTISIDEINREQLDDEHQHWLSHWTKCKVLGKNSLKLLPPALRWLQQCRERSDVPHQTEIWSKTKTHRVHVGKPSPGQMTWTFSQRPDVIKQCLIPHIRIRQTNCLFVFERGATWKSDD